MPQENKTAQEQQTKKPANDKKQGGNKKPTQQNNNKPKKSNAILEYKGKPLVRSGNTIYYGDINDAYVVCINIKNSSKLKDIKLAELMIRFHRKTKSSKRARKRAFSTHST